MGKNNNYCKGLSRQFLVSLCEWQVIQDEFAPYGWIVRRYWHKNHGLAKDWGWRDVKIQEVTCKHKYTHEMKYPALTLSFDSKHYAWSLSRFLYAYFKGDIPDGHVIDHIDNDQFNNDLDNLQMLTIRENNRKRFDDNPDLRVNQWGKRKKK